MNGKLNGKLIWSIIWAIIFVLASIFLSLRQDVDCCTMSKYFKGTFLGNPIILREGLKNLYEKEGDYRKILTKTIPEPATLENVNILLKEKWIIIKTMDSDLLGKFESMKIWKDCYGFAYNLNNIPEKEKIIKDWYMKTFWRELYNIAQCNPKSNCYIILTEIGFLTSNQQYNCD